MRIAEVAERTGVSRELIHHYLRQGLVPRSSARGRYSGDQVRLLGQIRILRDEHHLPLELIRQIFERFDFDPERIAPFILADSFARRAARLTTHGDPLPTDTFTADALAREAQVSQSRLGDYLEAGLIHPAREADPSGGNGGARFSAHDARVVALGEQAVSLGLPFDSLATIASYVRLAFALEHPVLFPRVAEHMAQPEALVNDVWVRLELISSFIQSLLLGLVANQLRDVGPLLRDGRPSMDHLIFRPSAVFVRKHGLHAAVEDALGRLGRPSESPQTWRETVALLIHAGRYNEATFFARQAHGRWPDHPELHALYGRAMVLTGNREEGLALLGSLPGPDPALRIFHLVSEASAGETSSLAARGHRLLRLEDALAEAERADAWNRLEAIIFGGWLLAGIPPALAQPRRGAELLAEALDELADRAPPAGGTPPGLRERLLCNGAYLLFDTLSRVPPGQMPDSGWTDPETLRQTICRLDPGSPFAERVFLANGRPADPPGPMAAEPPGGTT